MVRTPAETRDYLVAETSRSFLDLSQGPIPRVQEVSTQEVKRSGRETDNVPPSTAKSNNEWSYSSPPPYVFTMYTMKYYPFSAQ